MKPRYLLVETLFALILTLTGCNKGGDTAVTRELAAIDSTLTIARQYEAALQRLDSLRPEDFNKAERAYYSLLLTQAHYKNYIDDTTDAVINVAVEYYNHHGDREKRTRSLLYQGCVYEVMGEPEKAITSYKRIEHVADENDLANRAFAKLRLVELYATNLYYTQPKIKLAKEALDLYRQLDDKHYQLLCMTSLGSLFRDDSVNRDSALYYIGEAVKLAKAEHETWFEFQNLYHRAELYCLTTKDYDKAKADILQAIATGKEEIDHPRAHYIAAETYLNLGQRDSAIYYLKHAPSSTDASKIYSDTVLYYRLLGEIAKYDKDWDGYTKNFTKANSIADSVLIASVRKNFQEVEKKYDVQLAELNQVKNESRLRGTLLALAGVIIAALALLLGLLRYRNRLKVMENEAEMLRVDLDASLASLKQMQATIGNYENELQAAQAELKGNETAIAQLEAKKVQSDEMRAIVDGQIKIVHELLENSYRYDSNTFARKFNELMTMPEAGGDNASYWDNLQQLVNDLYNNVLIAAQETAGGTLRDDEVNYLALHCCGYSRTVIMICMKYKSLGTVSNKKVQIAHKLHVATLDDFIKPYITLTPHD